jgi:hypothetical protein
MATNNKVHEALQQIVANSDAVIDADLNFFCPEAVHAGERVSAIQ